MDAATIILLSVLSAYPAHRMETAPQLDGRLNDAAWISLPRGEGLHVLGGRGAIAKETWFKIGYTDKALYVGVMCREPDIGALSAGAKYGDQAIWKDDGIELFVLPAGADDVLQVIVNASGARCHSLTEVGSEFTSSPPLTISKAAAQRGDDFYAIEIELPFDGLGYLPKPGLYYINLLRCQYEQGPPSVEALR